MYFDARAAKLLQPGEHMVIDGCPGLRLVATATRKSWTYRYKEVATGRMKQVSIGQWPAMAVQVAAAEWSALRGQRAGGVDPVAQRKAERVVKRDQEHGPYTVQKLVDDFIGGRLVESRKPEGFLSAKSTLERALANNPNFAAKPAADVQRSDAFGVIDALKATPTAAAKLRSLMGAAWDAAHDAGKLDGNVPNWWRLVLKGRLKSKGKIIGGEHVGQQRRFLRANELKVLLPWLANMHTLGRDVTEMYLWTCARGVEVVGMRADYITEESDGWWWTVPKEFTKNARFDAAVDLRIPLIGRALAIAQRRLKSLGKSGWLFEDVRGEQYMQKDFGTYIYSLQPYSEKVKRRESEGLICPVTHWTPHALRRTGRTLLSSLGCIDEVAEAVIGHLPTKIVGVYNAYSYDAERRLWLGRLDVLLEDLAAKGQAGLPALP